MMWLSCLLRNRILSSNVEKSIGNVENCIENVVKYIGNVENCIGNEVKRIGNVVTMW
jgi:hypothetical protein